MGRKLTEMEEQEKLRGLSDLDLKKVSDNRLIMLALARFMKSQGFEDEVLIGELHRRGQG